MKTISLILSSALLVLVIGCGTTTSIVDRTIDIPGEETDTTVIDLDGGVYVGIDALGDDTSVDFNMYSEDYLVQIREDYDARIKALIEDCHGSLSIITAEGNELFVEFTKEVAKTEELTDSLGAVVGRYTALKNRWDIYQKTKDQQVSYTDTTETFASKSDVSLFEEYGAVAVVVLLAFGIGVAVGKFV